MADDTLLEILGRIGDAIERVAIAVESFAPHKKERNPIEVGTGRLLVPTVGTAVQLPSVEIPSGYEVKIRAPTANTGIIYLGNSKVEAENRNLGYSLEATEEIKLKIDNLNRLWIDSSILNQGIVWIVESRK